jgi:adenylate kinase
MKPGMYRGVLLFGYPGSGKGTQGRLLGMLPGFHHVAMGDIFRGLNASNPLFERVQSFIRKGDLVPDDLTMDLFMRHLETLRIAADDVVIIDGIPRNRAQAELLKARMEIIKIFKLSVYDESLVIDRIRKRAAVQSRADDASDEIIAHRLEVYRQETEGSIKGFPGTRLTRIQADQPVFFVHYDIMTALGKLQSIKFQ